MSEKNLTNAYSELSKSFEGAMMHNVASSEEHEKGEQRR